MKVKELITVLSKFNGDDTIVITDQNGLKTDIFFDSVIKHYNFEDVEICVSETFNQDPDKN